MHTIKLVLLSALAIAMHACGKSDTNADASDRSDTAATTESSAPVAIFVSSASDLPACAEANSGRLYYIKATKEFKLCQDSVFVDIDAKGNDGSSAPSGPWLLDGDGTPIGAILKIDSFTSIVTSNGGAMNVLVTSGTHATAPYLDATSFILSSGTNCNFTSTDCSGTCYQRSGVVDVTVDTTEFYWPAKNAVYEKSTGVFVRATGSETKVNVVLKTGWRHYDDGSGLANYAKLTCRTVTEIEQGNSFNGNPITQYSGPAYPITETFTFPTGINYPFKTPLSIGVAP